MIVSKIILTVIFLVGFCIYFSNSSAALIEVKQKNFKGYWNSSLLIICGILNFIMAVLFLLMIMENIEKTNKPEKPEYEIIQEPVYRKVK
jgi:predicted membrane protein